jgi:hypothetical protein
MNFKEAYEKLEQGLRVRRKAWDKSIFLQDTLIIECFREECVPFIYSMDIVESRWLVVGEGENEISFVNAIEELHKGKGIKLFDWPENCFLECSKDRKELFMRRITKFDFTPTFECFSANDWEVLEY